MESSPSVASEKSSRSSHTWSSYSRSTMDEDTKRFIRWRRFTLFAACFIPFGAQFAKQCLPPLRPYFEQMGVSSTQFGLYLSSPSWPNLFQPLVISLFVDNRGHESGAILFSTFALLGHALFAASLSMGGGSVDSAATWVGVFGRIVFGFGQGGSGIVQGAILGSHFESDLSFAIGLAQSVKNLSNWLGRLAPVAMAEYFGHNYLVPIWFCLLLLFISCLLAVVHVMFEEVHKPFAFNLAAPAVLLHTTHPHYSLDLEQRNVVITQERSRGLWRFIRGAPWAFWAINFLHLLFSNTSGLFTGFSTSFYVQEYGLSMQTSAFLSSLDALSPILVAPLVGKLVDKYGNRLNLLMGFGMLDVCCFTIFAYFGQASWTGGAWLPTLILSVAASAPSTLLKSCIPLVCHEKQDMMIAFSIYFVFENFGHAVGQLVLGHLRSKDTSSFQLNLQFLCGVSIVCVISAWMVKRWDQAHCDGLLSKPASLAVRM
ncbi:hypothetical protein BASA81_003621 [Batrachochytrium salamandrivorans]|nr:hypothetical protein BASA81_003621 [Batrachochytrium salamandrivorans]